jgi:hypothetical protein
MSADSNGTLALQRGRATPPGHASPLNYKRFAKLRFGFRQGMAKRAGAKSLNSPPVLIIGPKSDFPYACSPREFPASATPRLHRADCGRWID